MPDSITPAEKYHILAGILSYVRQRCNEIPNDALLTDQPSDMQFVRESIADACHAIDAAVADVPTEEEIATNV